MPYLVAAVVCRLVGHDEAFRCRTVKGKVSGDASWCRRCKRVTRW